MTVRKEFPTSENATVVFTIIISYADLFGALARDIRSRFGIRSILFYVGPGGLPSSKVYDFRTDDFAKLVDMQPLMMPRPRKDIPSSEELSIQARLLEKRHSFSVVDVIRSDRHLGNGFVSGAEYAYSSYGQLCNYDQSIDIVLRVADAAEAFFLKYKPIAFVSYPADIYRSTMTGVAESMGIPLRVPGPNFSRLSGSGRKIGTIGQWVLPKAINRLFQKMIWVKRPPLIREFSAFGNIHALSSLGMPCEG